MATSANSSTSERKRFISITMVLLTSSWLLIDFRLGAPVSILLGRVVGGMVMVLFWYIFLFAVIPVSILVGIIQAIVLFKSSPKISSAIFICYLLIICAYVQSLSPFLEDFTRKDISSAPSSSGH